MSAAIAIAGIHTDVGKTICAAIITEALQADYWKPVQAGSLDSSDSMRVSRLLSNKSSIIHPEALQLQLAASPHTAAAAEGIKVDCRNFVLPGTANTLIVETAGGLHSPIDAHHTMADFMGHHQWPAILVVRHYLGSINHTLLCLEVMRHRGIPLLGMVVSGAANPSSEQFIAGYCPEVPLFHIGELTDIDAGAIHMCALRMKPWLEKIMTHG